MTNHPVIRNSDLSPIVLLKGFDTLVCSPSWAAIARGRGEIPWNHLPERKSMARKLQVNRVSKRRTKTKIRGKKKDPLFVNGERPRPMYVDYKNLELLKKLINRQGKIISRRKSGCTAVSQHAATDAIKRARFMALLPYVGE